ncbi:Uncharacterised protein [Mycoplasmopsis caviae]|uniref:Uncharacterized protein n=1 Tax=Mycoplasmopsis caviae TaxID=55603 RepID=A0A3P8K8L7_9BACT|nr:Uncharacterised protein [Mycoplasmopsis caviae]
MSKKEIILFWTMLLVALIVLCLIDWLPFFMIDLTYASSSLRKLPPLKI